MIEENFLRYIPKLPFESEFINECRQTTGCNYYTYFLEDDPNYGTCILLSSIIEPLEECPTCVTGPLECVNFDDCGFTYNGKKETNMIFTQPSREGVAYNTSLSISTKCQLHILAVGGGGAGASGGGGSGYIQEVTHNFTSTPTLIKLFVGNKARAELVTEFSLCIMELASILT